jgi:hypothetical protein
MNKITATFAFLNWSDVHRLFDEAVQFDEPISIPDPDGTETGEEIDAWDEDDSIFLAGEGTRCNLAYSRLTGELTLTSTTCSCEDFFATLEVVRTFLLDTNKLPTVLEGGLSYAVEQPMPA